MNPYSLPLDIQSAPLGVSWQSIGSPGSTKPDTSQNTAALLSICLTATTEVEAECNQRLACQVITEQLVGPGHRIGIQNSGMARFITSFTPVSKVVAGLVAPVGVPHPNYTLIPAGNAYPEEQPAATGLTTPYQFGGGMAAIMINPAYMGWGWGREGTLVVMQYLNGWPNAQLTEDAAAGATTLEVSEVAGMTGADVWISDGGYMEEVSVTSATVTPPAWSAASNYRAGQLVTYQGATYQGLIASGPGTPAGVQTPQTASTPWWITPAEPTGPGTLTLATPTLFAHTAPVLVTGLPYNVRWATALYAKAQALQRGLATVSVPGTGGKAAAADDAIDAARMEAVAVLAAYRRIY